jgi:hypothetical protein
VTETILFVASVINALAAAGSALFAYKTVRVSERTLNEQHRIREIERNEQERIREIERNEQERIRQAERNEQQRMGRFEREDRRYEQQISGPMQEYLAMLSSEWYGMLQQGLIELDTLIARRANQVETAAFVRQLTFSLRETWRRASFKLVIMAEANHRSLSRELEKARDELDDAVARILNEHTARALPGRPNVQHSLRLAIEKHSVFVLGRIAEHAPRLEEPRAASGDFTRGLGTGTAPARRVQK